MSTVPTQKRLRLAVALQVVRQGLSVRFGRSVVTVLGVALGIAFLMSVLTAQLIKAGVADEQAIRDETSRMYNFFLADAGVPQGLVLAVVKLGPLQAVEERLIDRIAASGPKQVGYGPDAADAATAIMVVGDGALARPALAALLDRAQHPVAFFTRTTQGTHAGFADARLIMLERALSEAELAERREEAARTRFRNRWIVVIALFVTIIGITNSMLMSVTERFREIGTMKCLGALSIFVRQMFLIESSLVGLVGAVLGAFGGMLFSVVAYSVTYGWWRVLGAMAPVTITLYLLLCVLFGVLLSVVAALYPARYASRMLPAHALRSEV